MFLRRTIIGIPVTLAVISAAISAQEAERGLQRPFTATIRTTYLSEHGEETSFLRTFARRADGSSTLFGETQGPGAARGTFSFILDAVNGTYTSVDSFTRSAVVLPLSEQEVQAALDRHGTCKYLSDGTWTRTGEGTRFGLHTLEVDGASGSDKTKLLVATELNCFPVLDLLLVDGEVRTKEEVLKLQLGEPAPAGFVVPAGYDFLSPAQFEERHKKQFGAGYYGDVLVKRLEDKYQQAKAKGRLR
jgi:hypothetical protein